MGGFQGAFGPGIYFASTPEIAQVYCKYSTKPYLTVVRIRGRLHDGPPGWPLKANIQRLLREGYVGVRVTVNGMYGSFDEVAVYDVDAIEIVKSVPVPAPQGSRLKERYVEVSSSLFRESGVNMTYPETISDYVDVMATTGGWGAFPPIRGVRQFVDESDLEDWEDTVESGYEHQLAWSRPLRKSDLGREYVAIEDGHHRAHAASAVGVPIRVKIWPGEEP